MQTCHIFTRPVFRDDRGYFVEQFNSTKNSFDFKIEQVSESLSVPYTFRGFHFQVKNKMNKIIRVVSGKAHVYTINLLNDIPKVDYFQLYSVEHTVTTACYLYVPSHYAVAFMTFEDTRMQYFHDTVRSEHHRTINVSCVSEQVNSHDYKQIQHMSDADKTAMTWETWKSMKEEHLL